MNVHYFQFNYSCRHCLHSIKTKHAIDIDEQSFKKTEQYNSEFQVRKKLEELGAFNQLICPKCGSSNLLVYNLNYNNDALYDRNNLKSCVNGKVGIYIKIEKYGNQLKKSMRFSDNLNLDVHWSILELFLQEIIENTLEDSNDIFISSISGQAEIMLTGEKRELGTIIGINRFNNIGITKNELFKCIYDIAEKYTINVELDTINEALSKENFSTERDPLESTIFKGALMNEVFYLDSLEEAKELKIPYANVCFVGGDQIVAHGTSYNESPAEFYAKHKNDDFIISPNTDPIFFRGKMIYYAVKAN